MQQIFNNTCDQLCIILYIYEIDHFICNNIIFENLNDKIDIRVLFNQTYCIYKYKKIKKADK